MPEVLGEVNCPHHVGAIVADVKRAKTGKLYYDCPKCGLIMPTRPAFQDWVLSNATLYGPEGKKEAPAKEPPAPKTEAKETPPPAPPKEKEKSPPPRCEPTADWVSDL